MSRIFWNRKLILKIRLAIIDHPPSFNLYPGHKSSFTLHSSPSILHPPFFTRHPSPSILKSYRRIWSMTLMKPFLSILVSQTKTHTNQHQHSNWNEIILLWMSLVWERALLFSLLPNNSILQDLGVFFQSFGWIFLISENHYWYINILRIYICVKHSSHKIF